MMNKEECEHNRPFFECEICGNEVNKGIDEIDQIIEMAKKQKSVLNGILDETDENIIMTKRQNRSFQTRCSKVKNRAKAENRGEYIEICGMFTEGSALINSRNLIYRLDLCEKHFKEFTDKDI